MSQQVFQILSLLASGATWITATVAFLSLRLMRKQQQAAHRPELTPTSQNLYGKGELGGDGAPNLWSETAEPDNVNLDTVVTPLTVSGRTHREFYGVRLFNLGTGAAKDIHIEWRFAIDRLVEKINQMAQRSFAEVYFEHEKTKQVLSLKAKNGRHATYFLKNDLHSRHDYILPCSIENKGHKVRLPQSYIELASMYLYLAFDKKHDAEQDDERILDIGIIASYTDISGIRYSKTFGLKLKLFVYSHTEPPAFDAQFVPKGSGDSALN